MPFTKKTMRKMSPVARKAAKLHNEMHKQAQAMKRLVRQIEQSELAERALNNMNGHQIKTDTDLFNWPECPECGDSLLRLLSTGRFACRSCDWRGYVEEMKGAEHDSS